MAERLSPDFFNRPTLDVAKDLLGKILVFGEHAGVITETEAYTGQDDPACHAARGKTGRNAVMFGPSGVSYVYFIYGMYHCLNVVTGHADHASAVLIRGLQLTDRLLDGPGKICRHLGINQSHNALDLTAHPHFYLTEGIEVVQYQTTPRIGIRQAKEKLWRFLIDDDTQGFGQ